MVHLVSFPLILSFLFLLHLNLSNTSPLKVSLLSSLISFYSSKLVISSCLLLNYSVILSRLLSSLRLASHFIPSLLISCHLVTVFSPSSHPISLGLVWSHHLSSLLISLHLASSSWFSVDVASQKHLVHKRPAVLIDPAFLHHWLKISHYTFIYFSDLCLIIQLLASYFSRCALCSGPLLSLPSHLR